MAENRRKCPLYFKTVVCRRENHCPYHHNRPTISPTLLLSDMYQPPDMITPGIDAQGNPIDLDQIQEHFENFYEDLFKMLTKYGEIRWLNVCDNPANYMIGNVYVQFRCENQAEAALRDLQGKLYNLQPIKVEYSPVTEFLYATCWLFEQNRCERDSYCYFLHVKKIRRELYWKLFPRSRSQSRSPSYRRDRESRERSHERGDHRDRDRVRHERRYERRSRRSRYSRSQSRSRSRSPSYRRDDRETPHERGDQRSSERDGDRERYERRSRSEGRSRSPVRESNEERRAKIEQCNRKRGERAK